MVLCLCIELFNSKTEIMKKKGLLLAVLLMIAPMVLMAQDLDFYGIKVKTLEGDDFDLSSLKGKKIMIVNTASKCGRTISESGN